MKNYLPLFYWSEINFISKDRENYGDLLGKYLVEKISGRKVKWVHPKKQPWFKWNKTNYLSIGSIIHHSTKNSVVWGSGIIDKQQEVVNADFRAVRGPQTRKFLIDAGYKCPEIYGDPAILLPKYFNPKITKRYRVGIIPHYNDFKLISKMYKDESDVIVIDLMTLNIEDITQQILQCERTISSSLHGLIVSQAYSIPSIWVKFSENIFGDGIKYQDYLESVGIPFYHAPFLDKKMSMPDLKNLFITFTSLPKKAKIEELCKGLEKTCPF